MTIPAYPLQWPDGLPRTERKASSQFRSSLSAALKNVKSSLELFAKDSGKQVTEIVLSSNVGGLDVGQPADTGVAAWFEWDGQQRCIAVDRYPKVEDNLQAIHHIIEARRTEMRHGGLHIVRQTFKGFTALPAPEGRKSGREVLPAGRRMRWPISTAPAPRRRQQSHERQASSRPAQPAERLSQAAEHGERGAADGVRESVQGSR
jgi:hypothetical protein